MKWAYLLAVVFGASGVLALVLEGVRRQRERDTAATYVRDIQVLAPEKPLALPPVRPLKAQRESQPIDRVRRFQQRLGASR